MTKIKSDERDGLWWGLVLVGMGVVFLLVQIDVLPRHLLYSWWTWWPAILIGIGLAKLIRPRSPSDIGNGVMMPMLGLWFFANQHEWYGLHWGNSWPLAMVAAGMGMVAKAIAQSVMRNDAKEEPRG